MKKGGGEKVGSKAGNDTMQQLPRQVLNRGRVRTRTDGRALLFVGQEEPERKFPLLFLTLHLLLAPALVGPNRTWLCRYSEARWGDRLVGEGENKGAGGEGEEAAQPTLDAPLQKTSHASP